jgi:hypothetical protein
MRYSALAVIAATAGSLAPVPMAAQWIRYPTAGVPRSSDRKPNLSTRTPRTVDGKPDLSGVWQNDGYGLPNAEGICPLASAVPRHFHHGRRRSRRNESTRRSCSRRGSS